MESMKENLKKELQIEDEKLSIQRDEHKRMKAEIDELREKYLTLQLDNEILYREIDHQQSVISNYMNTKTENQLKVLKNDAEKLDQRAFNGVLELNSNKKNEAMALQKRLRKLEKLPEQWYYQDDNVVAQKLEEITSKLNVITTTLELESAAFNKAKESYLLSTEEVGNAQHFESFMSELKWINARLEVNQNH